MTSPQPAPTPFAAAPHRCSFSGRKKHPAATQELKDGTRFLTYAVDVSGLAEEAAKKGAVVTVEAPQKTSWWVTMLSSLFPTLLLIGVWIFFLYNMQGGGGKVMSFAKSKAKLFLDNRLKVTFNDVAGCDESKEELQEVIHFLKNPAKFTRLGALESQNPDPDSLLRDRKSVV